MGIWSDFAFDLLYPYMLSLASNDSSIIYPYENSTAPAFTYDACVAKVGTKPGAYGRQDVYDRVLLWRIPLIALWATTTLPELGIQTKIFTLLHLVADPIDTLWSLFYKLDLAKCTAEWSEEFDEHSWFTFKDRPQDENELTRVRKILGQWAPDMPVLDLNGPGLQQHLRDAIASIVTAYDEWGYGANAYKAIYNAFDPNMWQSIAHRTVLRDECVRTAFLVSSDRVSRILPSAISTLVFLVQISAGFWKILVNLGDTYDDTNPVSNGLNRAPHNIAFGALFFWLPLAVLMTALVGGSQTRYLMPRVLESFRHAVDMMQADTIAHPLAIAPECELLQEGGIMQEGEIAQDEIAQEEEAAQEDEGELGQTTLMGRPTSSESDSGIERLRHISSAQRHKRWSHGGLPVWQPAKWADMRDRKHRGFWFLGLGMALLAVMIPTGCAMALSALTPTEGFGCRNMAQLAFLLMWLLSLGVDGLLYWLTTFGCDLSRSEQILPKPEWSKRAYVITFVKDTLFVMSTVVVLTGSATGIFNSCGCWSKWFPRGETRYISFPQEDYIFTMIKNRLSWTFPIIVVGALASQVIIYIAVRFYFRKGHRVLKQRDIYKLLKSADSRMPQRTPTLNMAPENAEQHHAMEDHHL